MYYLTACKSSRGVSLSCSWERTFASWCLRGEVMGSWKTVSSFVYCILLSTWFYIWHHLCHIWVDWILSFLILPIIQNWTFVQKIIVFWIKVSSSFLFFFVFYIQSSIDSLRLKMLLFFVPLSSDRNNFSIFLLYPRSWTSFISIKRF